jgi:hypothetical protein
VDYYVRRSADYSVALLENGGARLTGSLTFTNDAPADASPTGFLVPSPNPANPGEPVGPGEVYQQAVITCAGDCRLLSSSIDDRPFSMEDHSLMGSEMFVGTMRIPPQESMTLRFTLDLGHGWRGDGAQGTYSLALPTPPLIKPVATSVSIHAPEGMVMAAQSSGMSADGSSAEWQGELSDVATFNVRFQRDTLGRMWWDITHAL